MIFNGIKLIIRDFLRVYAKEEFLNSNIKLRNMIDQSYLRIGWF